MSNNEPSDTIKYLRKRITTLSGEANALFNKILNRRTIGLFLYAKARISAHEQWDLDDLYQRTLAAQALGWAVTLHADDEGLHVYYAEKLPVNRPSSF